MLDDVPAKPADARAPLAEVERAVRCARCGHALTSAKAQLELFGRHAHTFMNPSGVIFDVRLYAEAPGAFETGAPDADTSWFPRTAWTYAHCTACAGHVGWRYVDLGDGRTFFGLIADSIVTR